MIVAQNILTTPGDFSTNVLPEHHDLQGSSQKTAQHRTTNQLFYHFSLGVDLVWTALPVKVAVVPSVDSFKRRLDKHVRTHGLSSSV